MLNMGNFTEYDKLRFCRGPGFCDIAAFNACRNTTVINCSGCNYPLGAFFIFLYFVLFVAIVFGNLLIPVNFFMNRGSHSKTDYALLSHSVSDFFIGLQVCLMVIPNAIGTFGMTLQEIRTKGHDSGSSLKANILGIIFLLCFTSSMYHLVFLSAVRLVAVCRPLWFHQQPNWKFIACLSIPWGSALIASAFPSIFAMWSYTYYESSFMYLPVMIGYTISGRPDLLVVLTLALPYFSVTLHLLATIVVLKVKRKRSDSALRGGQRSNSSYKREMKNIITICIMYVSFTLLVAPLLITLSLSSNGQLACEMVPLANMITSFFALSNSAANVIVYSARDSKFQNTVKRLWTKSTSCFR